MIRLAALETATEICSVALMEDQRVVACREENIPRQHAVQLPVFVRDIIEKSGWNFGDLDAIAVSIGPGSFTGLRVGLSFAKGLAYSQGLPLVPVSTLEGFARSIPVQNSGLSTILYSHGNQIYSQDWEAKNQRWSVLNPPQIQSLEEWTNRRLPDIPVAYWFGRKKLEIPENSIPVTPSAIPIGKIAVEDYERKIVDAFDLTPEYIAAFHLN
ncbi:MAG: tRNA (adenosine(37)-N6)-threonylcarbamoyltransferase complex dimerization subunit type 1 TsaB [FCB group bacterium]|nr:tRNA (adenosine(37)-N6)-threonylcarbamoyltransferase complex dimerization subunit type 1 TsaB [FCB group bacterium]